MVEQQSFQIWYLNCYKFSEKKKSLSKFALRRITVEDITRRAEVNAGQLIVLAPEVQIGPIGDVISIEAVSSASTVQKVSAMFCWNLIKAGTAPEIRREKLKKNNNQRSKEGSK